MTRRRDVIAAGAVLVAGTRASAQGSSTPLSAAMGGSAPAASTPATPAAPGGEWHNWSGIQSCRPAAQRAPGTADEVAQLLRTSTGPVRCVGAGHSFSALVPTTGQLLSLDRLNGIVSSDAVNRRVVVRAGTRLGVLARALDPLGLAMFNQPDVDVQTLAGAFSTGTHGTGAALPALHAHLRGLTLVTARGETLRASREREAEVFDAARVALGTLGVLTELELELRPRFYLRRRVWLDKTAKLLDEAPHRALAHRHFEMFVLPFTGCSAGIVLDEVPARAPSHVDAPDEKMLEDLRRLRDWFGRFPALRRWVAQRMIDPEHREESVDLSWRLLSTVRPTRFNETEYHVPRERGVACLREVIAALETRNDVFFPVELRFTRGDDAWLSPFHGGDRCSIAAHALQGEPHDYLVQELGPVFRRHGGRPHWGKLHDMTAPQLAAAYPRWNDFQRVRRALDPQGRMLNDLTRRILGESPA